jgi:hypothetical protein
MGETYAARRGTMNSQDNQDLLRAFPSSVRDDVLAVVSVLPENPHGVGHFEVQVNRETIEIPNRVYHNPALIDVSKLSSLQQHFVNCILTRHRDGHVRQNTRKGIARLLTRTDAGVKSDCAEGPDFEGDGVVPY